MRILLTGASGLLGSDIAARAPENVAAMTRLCLRPRPGFVDCDITSAECEKKIAGLEWDVMIHAAALKNPDDCELRRDETFKVNVEATRRLAKIAGGRKARMVFISTDYVFPGTNPPYREDDATRPLNYYGETKLEGERIVLENPGSLVVRVPFLYGVAAGIEASGMLWSSLMALDSEKPWPMEDSLVRSPTYTGDVADAVFALLGKGASGVWHFSGSEKLTRYGILKVIAEVLGREMRNIQRLESPPPTPAERPHDAHLCADKFKALCGWSVMPFRERMRDLHSKGLLSLEK